MTVPLIPFQRPVPHVLKRHGVANSVPPSVKAPKTKDTSMVATKKKPAAEPTFSVTNSEKITNMPAGVQFIWAMLSKMDPEGTLFVNNVAIVSLEGAGPAKRTPEALKFSAKETALSRRYGVLDAEEADDPKTARGVILTPYQLVQAAYDLGRADEASKVTSAITSAAAPDADDDDDDDEDFDEEEDEEASLDEEDAADEADADDEDEDDDLAEDDEDADEDDDE